MALQKTYNVNPPESNRADFDRSDFETLIKQKGRDVILEKALQCPCKMKDGNQQSNCKNCGGVGFLFINPKQTRMILQGMNVTPDLKSWSEEIKGDLKVTASDTEELTYMDRITAIYADAIFNEVIFFKTKGTGSDAVTFAYTAYNIKSILYIGWFKGVNDTFQRLVYGTDYLYERNVIKIINPLIIPIQNQISITVRYKHAPQYHMIDMKRESMESFELLGSEKLIHLPISGTARRAHYILDANNLLGDRLLNNSYATSSCGTAPTFCSQSVITFPTKCCDDTLVVPFVNQTQITIKHEFGRYVNPNVYDQNDLLMTGAVGVEIKRIDADNTKFTFPQLQSGTIVIS